LVTLIQSINSTLSRSIDQGGYTAISAYAASGSSIAAAFSAIILLISFLSQNKLIKGQIQQHNIYLKNQREIHYQQIREILKTATEHNSDFLDSTLISLEFINSLKLDYKIEDIKKPIENSIAMKHIKNDYPKFDRDLEDIEHLIDNLNNRISNFESQTIETVKKKII